MDISQQIINIAKDAKQASRFLGIIETQKKNRVLQKISQKLITHKAFLQAENEKDLQEASRLHLSNSLIDRLTLSERIIDEMALSLEEVATLSDPVGEIARIWRRPNGLIVGRMRIPLGVIGIIYESRPNVTVDAAALCLKSGNAVVLRGGKEAIHSNIALAQIIQTVLKEENIPCGAVQIIPTVDRQAVLEMLKLKEYIDVIIPRGGESLIRMVYETSQIPVIAHYKGVCHVFVDKSADPIMAEEIVLNAKVQRPGVCNAIETLLVHRAFAERHLLSLIMALKKAGVTVRGCERTCKIARDIERATEEDWLKEYLDLILSVRIVDSFEEATEHIAKYGSSHTEAIITNDYSSAQRFLNEVNSSVVLVNASTRFNDGNQLGLGAEIGISTSKIHAFGPMGLHELTTTKFVVYGSGHIRE